jgi:hypothetical protein
LEDLSRTEQGCARPVLRALAEVNELIAKDGSNHERYLATFRMLRERDKELADAFNDMRRSTAILLLARIEHHKLLTDEEFARFSPETRASVQTLLEIWAT